MAFEIANSPCSWGVDYADSPDNPDPKKVFREIAEAGYEFSELGPYGCLLYTSPSPRDRTRSRMPSSA